MQVLESRRGYKLWLDGGKLYDRQNCKTREITGISKKIMFAMYGIEKAAPAPTGTAIGDQL